MRGLTKGKWDVMFTREGAKFLADGRQFFPTPRDIKAMTKAPQFCKWSIELNEALEHENAGGMIFCARKLAEIVQELGLLS